MPYLISMVPTGSEVSPCCCACCLYPAIGLQLSLFSVDDLPDTVVVTHSIYGEVVLPVDRGATGVNPNYYYKEVEGDPVYVFLSTEDDPYLWRSSPEIGYTGTCLIDQVATSVRDQFPDTLYVNGTDEITRDPETNVCCWYGVDWTLCYNSSTYKFELNGVAKTGDQNTPEGTYGSDTVSA